MSEELTRKLDDVVAAKKRFRQTGDLGPYIRQAEEYLDLKEAEQRERAFGHPEDVPPMIERRE